jgi:hypothetical protein
MSHLKDYNYILGDWTPEAKRRMFWRDVRATLTNTIAVVLWSFIVVCVIRSLI